MQIISRLAILVHGTDKPRRKFLDSSFPGESVYLLSPVEGHIEVLPLDWWNDGDHDFGYEWIQRITIDPTTGNLIGDGKGALPFLMDSKSGRLLEYFKRDS
jgi:hypothetical protein